MAIMHRHNVLPRVLVKLVEITPIPNPSPSMVTAIETSASTPRKTNTDGLLIRCRVRTVLCKRSDIDQASAARPFWAMMPRGRNWMNRMMKMIM